MDQKQIGIDKLKETSDKIKEMTDNADKGASKELKDDPSYQLYQHIFETTSRVFDADETKEIFKVISSKMGEEISISLMSLMVLTVTHSAYDAIAFYDNHISDILNEQFTQIIDHVNGQNAAIDGMQSAMQIYRKQLNDISSKIITEDFAKANGIDQGNQ